MTTNQAAAWVVAKLKAVSGFGNRVFPDAAPKGTANPCAIYQRIDGEREARLDPGAPADGMVVFQIRIYAGTRKAAGELMEAARLAMAGCQPETLAAGWRLHGTAWGDGDDTHDADTGDYGCTAVIEVHGD